MLKSDDIIYFVFLSVELMLQKIKSKNSTKTKSTDMVIMKGIRNESMRCKVMHQDILRGEEVKKNKETDYFPEQMQIH